MKEYNTEEIKNTEEENEYAYKTVMDGKVKTRIWSVISVALAALSVVLCFIEEIGILLGAASIIMAIISRKSLGYFDKLSLGGLIGAIFGMVFSLAIFFFKLVIAG